jgi:hypothetical protein
VSSLICTRCPLLIPILGVLDNMADDCDQAHRHAFDNACNSLARCTALMQSTSARIDADQRLLRILEDCHSTIAASLLASPSGISFLLFLSFSFKTLTYIYLGLSAVPDSSPPKAKAEQD